MNSLLTATSHSKWISKVTSRGTSAFCIPYALQQALSQLVKNDTLTNSYNNTPECKTVICSSTFPSKMWRHHSTARRTNWESWPQTSQGIPNSLWWTSLPASAHLPRNLIRGQSPLAIHDKTGELHITLAKKVLHYLQSRKHLHLPCSATSCRTLSHSDRHHEGFCNKF